MAVAMAYVTFFAIIPIVITSLLFDSRKAMWRAIVLLSIISLAAEIVNVGLGILQISPGIPTTPSAIITSGDGVRLFVSGLAEYLGATAWVLCILVVAQQRRMTWASFLTVVAAISLVSLYVVDHPYSFFSPSGYGRGHEYLLLFLAHVITIITLLFGLLSRPKRLAVPPQPSFSAPPEPPNISK